jgi:hypothetical protein
MSEQRSVIERAIRKGRDDAARAAITAQHAAQDAARDARLQEIERRTHRIISVLFGVMATLWLLAMATILVWAAWA